MPHRANHPPPPPADRHGEVVRLARQQERVAALWRTSREDAGLDALLAEAVRHVRDELAVDHVEVCAGQAGGRVEPVAGVGFLRQTNDVATVAECVVTQAAFTMAAGEPVAVPDLSRERRFKVPPRLVESGAVSALSVVARGPAAAGGVLLAYTKGPREFSRTDVSFARAVADVLAAAIRDDAAARALRENSDRMRAVLDTVIEGIITIDERGTIESVNPAACRLFGYDADELIGRNVNCLMPEPYHSEHDGYMANYHRTGRPKIIGIGREVSGLRKDGTVFPLDLGVSEFRVGGRRMYAGVLRNLTEQRRLEREILEAAAQEQLRIGQDLHDGLCQELTGITFALEVLGQKLGNRNAPETPALRKVADLVDQAVGHARALAHGLQPVAVDATGLETALGELAAKVESLARVSCLFVSESEVLVHDNVVATHVFRVAQEAINNAVKHGRAKTIVVDLSTIEGGTWLRLTVSDDGVGMHDHPERTTTSPMAAGQRPADASRAQNGAPSKGIGMQTMLYRARVVGGRLDVRPGDRGGTVVECTVPLRGPVATAAVSSATVATQKVSRPAATDHDPERQPTDGDEQVRPRPQGKRRPPPARNPVTRGSTGLTGARRRGPGGSKAP